jgi:hypothetical protein
MRGCTGAKPHRHMSISSRAGLGVWLPSPQVGGRQKGEGRGGGAAGGGEGGGGGKRRERGASTRRVPGPGQFQAAATKRLVDGDNGINRVL